MMRVFDRWLRVREAVGKTPHDVVHKENKWRLLRYRARAEGRVHPTPILMVPSLINRHYVLDLLPQRSFIEFLVKRGHDVFIIDWGTPSAEDRFLEFDTICDQYIGRALRRAATLAGADRAHLMGYCLGGTLAVIHAAVHPERVATLSVLAAPIDFHDDGPLSLWTRTSSFDVSAIVRGLGNVPWQLMQGAFTMLRPTLHLTKGVTLLDRWWDDDELDGFFGLETWGNDNVSFPGACYERYIRELYQNNALVNGSFTLSGEPVRLENITCPTLNVTFEHDTIVPAKSAAILTQRIGSKTNEHLHLPGGHVGAVVSKKAAKGLWPRMAEFWEAQERAAAAQSARPA
jgi:polyhydroxyalkanoate synthase